MVGDFNQAAAGAKRVFDPSDLASWLRRQPPVHAGSASSWIAS